MIFFPTISKFNLRYNILNLLSQVLEAPSCVFTTVGATGTRGRCSRTPSGAVRGKSLSEWDLTGKLILKGLGARDHLLPKQVTCICSSVGYLLNEAHGMSWRNIQCWRNNWNLVSPSCSLRKCRVQSSNNLLAALPAGYTPSWRASDHSADVRKSR